MTDLRVDNHGSIFLLTPVSDAGREWVREHIDPNHQTWGTSSIVVEHRYIENIVNGATADGLTIE